MKRVGLVLLYVLLCVGLVIPMGNPGSPVSANGGAAVGVSPATQTVALGGTFSVDVVVDPGSYGISGGQVDIQFDPTAMSADSLVEGGLLGASPLVGSKLVDNGAGTLQLALGRVGATTPPTAAGVFATITFTGKDKPGTFAIDITFAGMADQGFNDIESLEITDGSVTFPGPKGTIQVASDPAGAAYTITGPANYSGTATGTAATIAADAPVGDYTIDWGDVTGYVTPANETKTLGDGGSITFSGVYTPAPGTIEVSSSPGGATFWITGPVGYGGTAPDTPWAVSTGAPPGDYTIAWGDMTGYIKPADETKTLAAGGKITFSGVYTEIPTQVGTIQVSSAPTGAAYSITGPQNYAGTATSTPTVIATDAPAGNYTIVWADVTGYIKPTDMTLILAAGGNITFNGIYSQTPGTIEVSSNPSGATYSIAGSQNYAGTATGTPTAIATDAPVGNYGIVWGDMTGYTKPANEVLTLTAGGKITFNGVYTEIIPPQVGTVEVASTPAGATFSITGAALYTGTATDAPTAIATDAPVGDYTIVWWDMTGYIKPADETLTLAAGGKITFSGVYIELPPQVGTIEVTSNVAAPFTVTGPALYTGTANWTKANAHLGEYTIIWGHVDGYTTPTSGLPQTLTAGGTITFDGVYEELPGPVGTVEVTSNIGAPYTVTGPATYTGIGDWTYDDSPVGDYTIDWGDVAGYVTPAGETLSLIEDGTITFDGQYEPVVLEGTIYVSANVPGARFTITGPADCCDIAPKVICKAPAGEYTIVWDDVPGCARPADETRTLAAGGTITFSGKYVAVTEWTHVFRDAKRGTVLYINTFTKTLCFTAPDGFTTGVQKANWMTCRKGRINLLWTCGNLRVSAFACEGTDYGQCWVTKGWRLKYMMLDPRGFEA